jgi:hypothetical protein
MSNKIPKDLALALAKEGQKASKELGSLAKKKPKK